MTAIAPLVLDEGDFIVEHLLSSNIDNGQLNGFVAGNNVYGLEVARGLPPWKPHTSEER